jgi:hypothetical protein
MALGKFLVYLATGRLLTWLVQTSGLARPLWDRHYLLSEMRECDLCAGFWVYLALSPRDDLGFRPRALNRLAWAAITSFTAHLLRLGWNSKFRVTVIE